MSEAELHVLKARLVGGVLNKAQRGELKMPLPIGFIHDEEDRVILDPDQQVQQSLRMFFTTFERVGSACLFCNLPKQRILRETPSVMAFFDGYPISEGHALVIPKRHLAHLFRPAGLGIAGCPVARN